MDGELLAAQPSVSDNGGFAHVHDLLNDIEFAQSIAPIFLLRKCFQELSVFVADVLDVPQPIVDEPKSLASQGGEDPAAAVVSHDEDVFDVQYVYGELHDTQAVQVRVHDHVGHIAVYENLSRNEPHNLICRHSAVGASNPQVIRTLLFGKGRKEVRLARGSFRRPFLIVVEQLIDERHKGLSVDSASVAERGHPDWIPVECELFLAEKSLVVGKSRARLRLFGPVQGICGDLDVSARRTCSVRVMPIAIGLTT